MIGDAITGGLIGAVLMAILNKILDIIQEKKRHKYSLQKAFFERKLQAVEAAVIKWYNLASAIDNAAIFYKQVLDEKITPEAFQIINTTLSSQLTNVSKKIEELSSSIPLYMDIDELRESEAFKEYLTCFSRLSVLNVRGEAILKRYKKCEGTQLEAVSKELDKFLEDCKISWQEIVSLFKTAYREHITLLRKARQEMKKYE